MLYCYMSMVLTRQNVVQYQHNKRHYLFMSGVNRLINSSLGGDNHETYAGKVTGNATANAIAIKSIPFKNKNDSGK